jgi:hypothetical protein
VPFLAKYKNSALHTTRPLANLQDLLGMGISIPLAYNNHDVHYHGLREVAHSKSVSTTSLTKVDC